MISCGHHVGFVALQNGRGGTAWELMQHGYCDPAILLLSMFIQYLQQIIIHQPEIRSFGYDSPYLSIICIVYIYIYYVHRLYVIWNTYVHL